MSKDERCIESALFAVIFCCCGALKSVKSTLFLFSIFALVITLGSCFSFPSWFASKASVMVISFLVAALTGAVTPRPLGNTMYRRIMVIVFSHSILFPFLGVVLFVAMRASGSWTLGLGALLCSCLPPSSQISEYITSEASGRSFLCRHIMLFTLPIFAVLTPFLFWGLTLVLHTQNVIQRSVVSLAVFPSGLLLSFFIGVCIHFIRLKIGQKSDFDPNLEDYFSLFSDDRLSEILEANRQKWRGKCSVMRFILLFILYVVVMSSIMRLMVSTSMQSSTELEPGPRIGVFHLVYFVFMVLTQHIIVLGVNWRLPKGFLPDTPEDRIALLLCCIFKSEALILPFLFCCLNLPKAVQQSSSASSSAAQVMLGASLFLLVQIVMTLISVPLKRWHTYSKCRPGTALLPSRFERMQRVRYPK